MAVNEIKRGRGRPKKAKIGDMNSIQDVIKESLDKFDVRLANELDDLLTAYYKLGTEAESETTRRTVLKELIDHARNKLAEGNSSEQSVSSPEGEKEETFAPLISLVANDND